MQGGWSRRGGRGGDPSSPESLEGMGTPLGLILQSSEEVYRNGRRQLRLLYKILVKLNWIGKAESYFAEDVMGAGLEEG